MTDRDFLRDAVDLATAIGEFSRSYRKEHGITQDMLAAWGRLNGASWSSGSISQIEHGNAAPALPTLITLCQALGAISDSVVRPADMFDPDGVYRVNEHAAILGADLIDFLSATEREIELMPDPEWIEKLPKPDFRDDDEEEVPFYSLAERRAARRLGVDTERVAEVARKLWGMSLDQKSEVDAGDNATAQAKGHVTRRLIRELRDHLGESE